MKTTVTSCLSLLGAMICGGQIDRAHIEKLDVHIQEVMRDQGIPGMAVAVAQGTNIVFSRGYGDGITPQTSFKIGSLSKSFVALAIMQLEEQGKLDLDSPVRRYLPWFRMMDAPESDKITVRHLLYHRSGISDHDSGFHADRDYDRELNNLILACPKMSVVTPPGERYAYANIGYDFLGAIVSAVSGSRLPEYVRLNIFAPLGMRNSYTSVVEANQQGLVVGYRFLFGRTVAWDNIKHHPPVGAGGLISSAEDLGLYLSALMNGGALQGNRILTEPTLERLFRSHNGIEKPDYYAMAWQVATAGDPPVRIFSHGGGLDGFAAEMAFRPDDKLAVVLLMNASSATKLGMNQLVHGAPSRFLRGLSPPKLTERHPMYYMTAAALWLIGLSAFVEGASIVRTFLLLRRWRRGTMPAPTRRIRMMKWWLPLAGHLLIAVLMLWVIPRAFGVGLPGLIRAAPDWGSLGVGVGSVALIWGPVRSVLVGKRLGRSPGIPVCPGPASHSLSSLHETW